MARVPRPVENVVLQGLRIELERHGFRYKARRLIKRADLMTVSVQIERYQWACPHEEIFDVRADFQIPPNDPDCELLVHQSEMVGRRCFYGDPEPPAADTILSDFRTRLLPVILENHSPPLLTEALLADHLAANVPNHFSKLDRAIHAYRWADRTRIDPVRHRAMELLRSLANAPGNRESITFTWKILGLPGDP
jgi:hypothetical protein